MSDKEFEKERCHYCGNWTDYDGEGMIRLDDNPIVQSASRKRQRS